MTAPHTLRTLRTLALVVPLLTLSGCFDFLEEIWINEDGSGRVRIDVGITTALFALGGTRMRDELQREFEGEAEKARKAAAEDPDVRKITVETREEGGLLHIVYDIEVRDVTRLPDIQRRMMEKSDRVKRSRSETPFDMNFRIEESDQGYRFVQTLGTPRPDAGTASASATEVFAQQMAAAMFADKGLTVRLHGPKFASHNGALSADGKTVEWHIPFSRVLAGGGLDAELRAEVVTGKMTIFYVAGGAVALLLVLAGLSLGKKRRPSSVVR